MKSIHLLFPCNKKSQKHTHTIQACIHRNGFLTESQFCGCAMCGLCIFVCGMTLRQLYDYFFKMHGFDLIWANSWCTLDLFPVSLLIHLHSFRPSCAKNQHQKLKQYFVSTKTVPPSCPKNLLMAIHFYRMNNERQQNKWQMNAKHN